MVAIAAMLKAAKPVFMGGTRWLLKVGVAWALLIGWLLFGGQMFIAIEGEPELKRAEEYCRSMDRIIKKMEPMDRAHFTGLLNKLVGKDLCRAPICVVSPLEKIGMKFADYPLTGNNTEMAAFDIDALKKSIANTTGADVANIALNNVNYGERRRLDSGSGRMLATKTVTFDLDVSMDGE